MPEADYVTMSKFAVLHIFALNLKWDGLIIYLFSLNCKASWRNRSHTLGKHKFIDVSLDLKQFLRLCNSRLRQIWMMVRRKRWVIWHGRKDLLNKFTIFRRCAVNPVTESGQSFAVSAGQRAETITAFSTEEAGRGGGGEKEWNGTAGASRPLGWVTAERQMHRRAQRPNKGANPQQAGDKMRIAWNSHGMQSRFCESQTARNLLHNAKNTNMRDFFSFFFPLWEQNIHSNWRVALLLCARTPKCVLLPEPELLLYLPTICLAQIRQRMITFLRNLTQLLGSLSRWNLYICERLPQACSLL